ALPISTAPTPAEPNHQAHQKARQADRGQRPKNERRASECHQKAGDGYYRRQPREKENARKLGGSKDRRIPRADRRDDQCDGGRDDPVVEPLQKRTTEESGGTMIQKDQWQDDVVYIRGGGRVIEARRLPEGWSRMWQTARVKERPFDPFPSLRKAIKAAKQSLTEVGDDAGY